MPYRIKLDRRNLSNICNSCPKLFNAISKCASQASG